MMREIRKAVCLFLSAVIVLARLDSCGVVLAVNQIEKTRISALKITNAQKRLRLRKGKSYKLKTNVRAKFISSNRKVVRVNSQGLIKGVRVGTAKIVVISRNKPNRKVSLSVSVTKDILVTSIRLSRTKITADEFNEKKIQLSAQKIRPSKAKNKRIEWFSSDAYVADVDENGKVTTGNAGTAMIIARAADQGGAYATCRVTVTESKEMERPVASRGREGKMATVVPAAPTKGADPAPTNEPGEEATSLPKVTTYPPADQTPAPTPIPTWKETPAPTLAATAIPSEIPDDFKNPDEVAALKELIDEQRSLGATVSKDLDSEEYVWNGRGNLVEIRWGAIEEHDEAAGVTYITGKRLSGSISVSPFSALTSLECGYSRLSGLDVSKNLVLEVLDCEKNQLKSLDISGNPDLTILNCGSNQLISLDVSECADLNRIMCYDNQLKNLDVSGNLALEKIDCSGNQLSSLDVSKNLALEDLNCYTNQLDSLDVSGNLVLERLWCGDNPLRSLDVSNSLSLKELSCANSKLKSLDVSALIHLTELTCRYNSLESLDLSGNTQLKRLWCGDNRLSSLDLSGNLALENLECDHNQLSSLDLSGNKNLHELECDSTVTVIGYKG